MGLLLLKIFKFSSKRGRSVGFNPSILLWNTQLCKASYMPWRYGGRWGVQPPNPHSHLYPPMCHDMFVEVKFWASQTSLKLHNIFQPILVYIYHIYIWRCLHNKDPSLLKSWAPYICQFFSAFYLKLVTSCKGMYFNFLMYILFYVDTVEFTSDPTFQITTLWFTLHCW